MERLKGKVCIVTGVSEPGAIGYGIAKVFAKEGATVVCIVRRQIVFDRVKELTDAGYRAIGIVADLSKAEEVKKVIDQVLTQYGKIDVLVNNAGGGEGVISNLMDTAEESWDRVIDSNLKSCMLCTKAVLPSMIEKHNGKIVNVSSVTGPIAALSGRTAYAASKGGVSAFTRALALEVGEFGITVNSICPGFIYIGSMKPGRDKQKMENSIPVKRLGSPEDIGYLALFLSTNESDYITGQDIVIDGGNLLQEMRTV